MAEGGDAKTAHEVVLQLTEGLQHKAHMVYTDNFFTSIPLLPELRRRGTYGVGTMRGNIIDLPKCFKDMRTVSMEQQESLFWRMHSSGEICCIVSVDRKAVKFLSTFFPPIPGPCEAWPTVPRQIDGELQDLAMLPPPQGIPRL